MSAKPLRQIHDTLCNKLEHLKMNPKKTTKVEFKSIERIAMYRCEYVWLSPISPGNFTKREVRNQAHDILNFKCIWARLTITVQFKFEIGGKM